MTTHIPNLVIAQHLVHQIAQAAERYQVDETGEAMIGVLLPGDRTGGVPTVYILGTIAPDEADVERQAYVFAHGGESQYEAFTWLLENWRNASAENARLGFGEDAILSHIGDWHKQPGFMIAPSGGDLSSALGLLAEHPEIERWIAPIVTLNHPSTLREGAMVNYLTVPDAHGTLTRIDFWLIDRSQRAFRPMHPVVYPDEKLPGLAPLPWTLTDDARLSLEIGQLENEGWLVSPMVAWDTDLKAPLEACFMLGKPGAKTLWLIATPHDFPARPPRAYRAPFVPLGNDEDMYDAFQHAWASADPVKDPQGWDWSPDLYLIDYVHALENTTAAPAPAASDDDQEKP